MEILLEESLSDSTQPLVRISFVALTAQATIKTFHLTLQACLTDIVVLHEQTRPNPHRFFSTMDQKGNLLKMNCLLTSPENPLFYSSPYDRIENQVHLQISTPMASVQLEAVKSLLRFRDGLVRRVSEGPERNGSKLNEPSTERPSAGTSRSITKITVDVEQVRVRVETTLSPLLDIRLHGGTMVISRSIRKSQIIFVLRDVSIDDLHAHAHYPTLLHRENRESEVLFVDAIAYDRPKFHQPTADRVDYELKINCPKMTIVLFYKYIDLLLNLLAALPLQRRRDGNEPTSLSTLIEKFQTETFLARVDLTIQAPKLFIPVDSFSKEGILLDLGELSLHNHQSSNGQHLLVFKDVQVTHRHRPLIESAACHALIRRHVPVDDDRQSHADAEISIDVDWKSMDISVSNEDYSCLRKILEKNCTEKVFLQSFRDEALALAVPTARPPTSTRDPKPKKMEINFDMESISCTFHLLDRDSTRASAFLKLEVETIEARFRQASDDKSETTLQVQQIHLDDFHGVRLLEQDIGPIFTMTIDSTSNVRHGESGTLPIRSDVSARCLQ